MSLADERCLRIPGLIEKVSLVCDFVGEAARLAGLDERAIHHCQVALDEVCTNIIHHGFEASGRIGVIEIVCSKSAAGFAITISDDSPAFNPLFVPDPNPTVPLDERQPGGWGIYFIKQLMDDVQYRHEAGRNHLMLLKRAHTDSLSTG